MKAVILAGGYGTRLSEETVVRPKPMIEIGGKPILWHIMKIYSAYNINEFIICCGYKGYMIKEYFANYYLHTSDITFDMVNNKQEMHETNSEPWKVTLIDTGCNAGTGGRLRKVISYIDDDFCFTYGDGLGSINITDLIDFHKKSNTLATVTAVLPPSKYGVLSFHNKDDERSKISAFEEKPTGDEGWVNGGFFVLSPQVIDYIKGDDVMWEHEPMRKLAEEGQVAAYKHKGFWRPMDTARDKNRLEEIWNSGNAPWKVW